MIGVSGGVDSCALYHALKSSGRELVVLHYDHGWRAESKTVARWVEQLAKSDGNLCVIGRAPRSQPKTESAARAGRWAFFVRTARRLRCPDLVLAHHADDQVETFLLQLFRGTGSNGAGMRRVWEREGVTIHRPWLSLWRGEILAYAQTNRLAWCEDPSNADAQHRRNYLRHELIPALEQKFGSQLAKRLWRTAEIARDQSAWVQQLVAEEAQAEVLDVLTLRQYSDGHQRALLFSWLQVNGINDISFADIESARGLLEADRPAKINLSKGRFLWRKRGYIILQ